MNNDRTAIDEIKRKLTLKQVIDKFGGAQLRGDGDQLVGWHSVHESTSKSSLEVDNKKGVYHCFGCKEGGDMFDWVGHVKFNSRYDRTDGAMFGEVLRDLAAFAGVELPERNAEKVAERRSIEEIWQLAADYYHAELTQQHRDYLHSRYGLTDGVIDTLKIGFAPKGERNLLGHLVKNHKIDGDELVKTGLFHRFDNGNIQDHFQGRIIFPYWVNERPVYFIGRETADSPQWEKDKGHMKYKKLLVHNDKHPYVSEAVRNDYFYGEDVTRNGGDLFVTEGVTDCIIANQYGFNCISPVTVQFRKADFPRLLELTARADTIYIANDSEASGIGNKGALATAKFLWENGRIARLVTLPRPDGVDKVDLNDFLRDPELGPEAFQALLSESKTLLDLLLEKVSNGATNTELIALQKEVIELVASIDDPYQRTNWQNTLPAQLKLGQRQYNNLIKKAVATRRRKETEARLAAIEARRGKPAIQMNDRQLSDITADALDALNTANAVNPRVFIRGGVLSRIIQDERGHYGVQELNEGAMLHIAAEVAAWQNVTESEEGTKITSADPRSAIIKALLNRGEWEGIPALAGIVNAPVFSADGILHSEPGYNAKSRLYYTGGVKVDDTTPTKRNIKRAKALFFDDLLVDFPFKDDASKAHAIGYLLLPFVRDMIQGPTPVHTVDSPTAGTGKGKLLNSCGYPFLGYDVPTMAAAKDDDEWRKRITTHLMGGSSHLTIDNINHELDSGSLASAFTQPLWEDRTLGFNREVKIPIRTVWGITANNIKMSQEIARRCVWIRLDANEEKPWLRTEFKHKNLIQWVSEHRNELVTAALTLIQAWIDAGRPKHNGRPKGSYEAWADVIGGILQTVGIDGFLANEDELYERVVSKSDLLADFVKAWWVEFPDKAAPAYELFKLASFSDDDAQNVIGTWHNLLGDMLTSSKERGRQTQLGKILAENQDKVISGYKISFAHASNGVKFWKLEPVHVEPDVEPVEPQSDSLSEVLHRDDDSLPPVEKGQNTPKVEPVEPVEPFNEIRDRENKFNFTHLDGEKKNISRIGTAEKGSLGSTDDMQNEASTGGREPVEPQNEVLQGSTEESEVAEWTF